MADATGSIRVWDPAIRVFHGSLAAAFAAAWATGEEATGPHQLLGYAILALVGARLVWGAVGSHHARFASFVRGPGAVAAISATTRPARR
jgi:cytochrome b